MGGDVDEEVDVGVNACCSVAGGGGGRCGRRSVRVEMKDFFEAVEIAAGFDEFVEEIVV